jgi:hypothetical protein
MAVLQTRGRIALARAIAQQPIHLAWGRGLPAWDDAPEPEPTNAAALVDEVGRRLATHVGFVLPDAAGEIEMVSGKYTASAEPTQWVHVRATFDFADAVGEELRELGIFIAAQPVDGLPAGQRYFTPEQIAEAGELYCLERIPVFTRNGAVRQVFEYVLPF